MNKKFFTFNHDEPDSFSLNLPCSAYTSFDTISPNFSQGSPYHDTDSLSDKSKKIRKKRNTYQKIDDDTRKKLLDAVQQGDTLKAAAKRYGINYSSAKSILHTYRKEGRICKKSAQERTSRRRNNKLAQDMEMSPIYYKQLREEFNHGVNETSTYQTYHSPEDSPVGGLSEDEGFKAGVSGLVVNSFGGFLKVIGSHNQPVKENLCVKSPGSTILLKLDSQKLQKVANSDINRASNGNNGQWQGNSSVPGEELKAKGYESSYGNYNFSDIVTGTEESQIFIDGKSCDVSYFLSSSPAYEFQQNAYGFDGCGNNEGLGGIEHFKNVTHQEMYYDGGNIGLMKTAGLIEY